MEHTKGYYLEELQEPDEKDIIEEELLEEIQDFLTEVLNEEIPTEKIAYRFEQLFYKSVDDPEINLRIVRYKFLLDIMVSRRKVLETNTCEELVKAVVSLEFGRHYFRNIGEEWKPIH